MNPESIDVGLFMATLAAFIIVLLVVVGGLWWLIDWLF